MPARTRKGPVLTWGRWVTSGGERARSALPSRSRPEEARLFDEPRRLSRQPAAATADRSQAPRRRHSRHSSATSRSAPQQVCTVVRGLESLLLARAFAAQGEQSFRLYGRPVDCQLFFPRDGNKCKVRRRTRRVRTVRTPELCCSCALPEVSKVSGVLADETADGQQRTFCTLQRTSLT